jgi:serine/threonine-protein kinase
MTEKSNFSHVKRLGNYRLQHPLGIGGMGEVYLAVREPDQTRVAVKLLLPSLANNRYHLSLFLKEIGMLSRIKHPGIVRVLDAGVQEDICFFVMDYIEGRNLVSVIDEDQPVSELAALTIIRDAAVILRDVYRKYRIIHRDIKPENIMITQQGSVHVLDFGLSRGLTEAQGRNAAGIGTAHFAAPEQQLGQNIDFRADIYALGATLFQLLTGRYPYECATIEELREAHASAPLPEAQETRPDLSEESAAILKRSLAKPPEGRYSSWREMIHSLNKAIRSVKRKKYSRRKRFRLLFLILLVSLPAAGHFYARRQDHAELPPASAPVTPPEPEAPELQWGIRKELNRLDAYSKPLLGNGEFAKVRELWLEQLTHNELQGHEAFRNGVNRFLSKLNVPEKPIPPPPLKPQLQGSIGLAKP